MRSQHHAVYVISVAAELAGMHPQTLRIYERRGLVQPARTQGGNRRYSDVDIECLRRIGELAATGMNLEGIRRVMELESGERSPARRERRVAPASRTRRWPRPIDARPVETSFRCARKSRCSVAHAWAVGRARFSRRKSASVCHAERITSPTSVRSSCIVGSGNASVETSQCGLARSAPMNSRHSGVSNGDLGGAGCTRRR